MASVEDFYIYVYEQDWIIKFKEDLVLPLDLVEIMGEGDQDKLNEQISLIKSFDFEKMKNLAYKLKLLEKAHKWTKTHKLREEYNILYKQYQKLCNMEYRLTGQDKCLLLFFGSLEEVPVYQNTSSIYKFLKACTIIRNNIEYPIDDGLILEVFGQNPNYYRESVFFDQQVDISTPVRIYGGMFESYFNKLYPIKHKDSLRKGGKGARMEELVSCQESKNGILRGLVHMIGYTGYDEPDDVFLTKIINSGYLEIQFQERNQNSGIFTTMLGYGNDVEKLYGITGMNAGYGIYFILSLKALEDFDYWGGTHGMGTRKKTHFYKGICHKCDDKSENYSAVERCYMAMAGDNHEKFYELVFSGDLSLRRYLEAIYVPDGFQRKILMESEIVPEYVKSLIIDNIPKDKVFRKGCDGETPKQINRLEFNKLVKVVKKREQMDTIPKVNYESINIKRKAKILYDPLKGGGGKVFPTPI